MVPQSPRQRSSQSKAGGGDAPAGGAMEWVLHFDPDTVARAIVFHMLDEGLAREVQAESVKRTVARLRRRGLCPAIRRSAWELMTNHDRLEWLLSETLTVPLMQPDGNVVAVETRDDR
jgi:hypothetical protein